MAESAPLAIAVSDAFKALGLPPVLVLRQRQVYDLVRGVRRAARAALLEELADEMIAKAGDVRDRMAVKRFLAFGAEYASHGERTPHEARTLYRRAKEERDGR